MDNVVQIFFIYANICEHCTEARVEVLKAMNDLYDYPTSLTAFHYDTKVGLKIAINNGIDDLPGLVISGGSIARSLIKDDITYEEVHDLIIEIHEKMKADNDKSSKDA